MLNVHTQVYTVVLVLLNHKHCQAFQHHHQYDCNATKYTGWQSLI